VAKLTKNQKKAHAKLESGKTYSLKDAAALVKEITTTKFDASVDIDVSLGVDLLYRTEQVKLYVY
jgi:large subunit ribosomal protein L1